jgi:hypothetical protein
MQWILDKKDATYPCNVILPIRPGDNAIRWAIEVKNG